MLHDSSNSPPPLPYLFNHNVVVRLPKQRQPFHNANHSSEAPLQQCLRTIKLACFFFVFFFSTHIPLFLYAFPTDGCKLSFHAFSLVLTVPLSEKAETTTLNHRSLVSFPAIHYMPPILHLFMLVILDFFSFFNLLLHIHLRYSVFEKRKRTYCLLFT